MFSPLAFSSAKSGIQDSTTSPASVDGLTYNIK